MFVESGYTLLDPVELARRKAAMENLTGRAPSSADPSGVSVTTPVEVSCPGACVPCSVSPEQAAAIAQGAAGAVAMRKGSAWVWAALIFGVGYWMGRRS
jgi:uncharacterized protein YggE